MAQSPSLVDVARSFVNHALSFKAPLRNTMMSFLLEYFRSMRLNTPSIRTLDIPANSRSRDIGEMLLNSFQPLRYLFRRLIIAQVTLNECSQLAVKSDLLPNGSVVSALHIGSLFGICRIVGATLS